jgi:hypothetical protein
MFYKKYKKEILEKLFILIIFLFFLHSKNAVFTHWSNILDQDITIIYNSLLLSSGIDQQYHDHPAYSTMFLLNIIYQICYFLNLTNISNITDLLNNSNKNDALQNLYNISLTVHLIYGFIFLLLLNKILKNFIDGNTIPFLLTIIILFSPAFIGTFDLIRSEILSIIFCFLYYIFLEKSLKNKINLIISGSCLSLAMLAKVQVIFSIFGFLLIFFFNNFNKGNTINYVSINFIKDNFNKINIKIMLINLIFLMFMIIFYLRFFHKLADGIFFLVFFLSHFFILNHFKKKGQFITTPIIQFFFWAILIVIFLKYLPLIGITNSFSSYAMKLMANPISASSMIITRYHLVETYGADFILKLFQFIRTDYGNINQLNIIFNKLSIITYIIGIITIILSFIKNENNRYLLLIIIFTFTIINLVISIRPNSSYLLYSYPFNLILIAVIFKKIPYKKFFTLFIFTIFLLLEFSNINSILSEKRRSNGNMTYICQIDQIKNSGSYMRYWQSKFDEEFLYNLCKNYFDNN